MNEQYARMLSDATRSLIGDGVVVCGATISPERVFDQADPLRIWEGTPTVEFQEQDRKRSYYLSGEYRDVVQMECAVRTQTQQQACAAVAALKTVIKRALDALIDAETADSYEVMTERAYPDERGVAVGETFYGVLEFRISECKKNEF